MCRDHFFREGFIMRAVFDTMVCAPPLIWGDEQFAEAEARDPRCPRPHAFRRRRRDRCMSRPIVVIPAARKVIEGVTFDAVGAKYSAAVAEVADCQPLPGRLSMLDIKARPRLLPTASCCPAPSRTLTRASTALTGLRAERRDLEGPTR